MKLIPNAGQVLRKAWSVWLMGLACVLIVLEPVLDALIALSGEWAPSLRIALSTVQGLVSLGAIGARFLVQKELHEHEQA